VDFPLGVDLLLGAADVVHNVPRVWVLTGVVSTLAVLAGVWVYLYFFDKYHFQAVVPGVLYRDGLRNLREFNNAVTTARAKSVVSLLDDQEYLKEPFNQEWEYLNRANVKFISIPIKLGGFPTTADVQKFLEEVEKRHRQPMLIHCAQGIRRTGMMVAAYQMSVMGWDKDRTKAAIQAYGHSERTIGDIKKFIDVYDPEKREVTKDLGMGTE
jgi:protein tyrosine/serine phosphatase